jgi:ribosomal protein S24E
MPAISQLSDPSIYSNIKAPEAMSLGDMVNLSRNTLALKKEKELYEPSVAGAKATSESAQVAAKKATAGLATDFADKMRQQQIALINHPDIVRAEQDPQFAAANKDKIAKLVNGQAKAAEDLGLDPTKASELNAPYLEAVNQTNGQGLRQFLKTRMVAGLDQQAQAALQPKEYLQAAPVKSETGNYPIGTQVAPVGVTSEQMNQPAKSDFSKPVALSYPVRQAGQAFTALPQEEDERKVNTAAKSALIARQNEIPQSRRTIDEVIKKAQQIEKEATFATEGFMGSAERNFSTFVGTQQGIRYKELSKDLANAQIANIKAGGAAFATDSGKNLEAMANGDVTYPPTVLIEIARRTQGQMLNLDSKATAIKKFADKFGDQNINAFNQMWSANADPKIFELKNIFDDQNMSADEKTKARDALIGKDAKQIKIFNEKWNNIKKLEQTGSL